MVPAFVSAMCRCFMYLSSNAEKTKLVGTEGCNALQDIGSGSEERVA